MISDTLCEAEIEIRRYLAEGFYGHDDSPWRRAIENLLGHMEAVRLLPGFDLPPDEAKFELDLAAITSRWGPHADSFPISNATLDEILRLKGPTSHGQSDQTR